MINCTSLEAFDLPIIITHLLEELRSMVSSQKNHLPPHVFSITFARLALSINFA